MDIAELIEELLEKAKQKGIDPWIEFPVSTIDYEVYDFEDRLFVALPYELADAIELADFLKEELERVLRKEVLVFCRLA